MAFLTIGILDASVMVEGFTETEHATGGSDRRMFDGTLRRFRKYTKREFRCTLYFATQAAFDDFVSDYASGASVLVTGDAVDGAALACRITVTDAPYIVSGGGMTHFKTAQTTIREL
jgi:hypothetical protein